MKTKETFFHGVKFHVGNGNTIRFWEDTWLGETPLSMHYPVVYNIVRHKEAYVVTILHTTPLNIQFRRSLIGERWNSWLHLIRRLMDAQFSNQPDTIQWNLTTSGSFSVNQCCTLY